MTHETPSQETFEEMQNKAKEVWETYDNTYGYVDEKLNKIKNIDNIQDNAMTFYRMFDHINQKKFRENLSKDTLIYISKNL